MINASCELWVLKHSPLFVVTFFSLETIFFFNFFFCHRRRRRRCRSSSSSVFVFILITLKYLCTRPMERFDGFGLTSRTVCNLYSSVCSVLKRADQYVIAAVPGTTNSIQCVLCVSVIHFDRYRQFLTRNSNSETEHAANWKQTPCECGINLMGTLI